MQINRIELRDLRNDKHLNFHTEFRDVISTACPKTPALSGAEALKMAAQFEGYSATFDKNSALLIDDFDNIFTGCIQVIDRRRDAIFDGMAEAVRGALHHFCPNVSEAAKRLEVVLDDYEQFAHRRSPKEQTVAINNLLEELGDSSNNDVRTVHIGDWVHELATNNKAFDKWVKECYDYDKKWQQTDIALRDARRQLDDAYNAIVRRINALVIMEGMEAYDAFIRQINLLISRYK